MQTNTPQQNPMDVIDTLVGSRVRVTWPNGYRKSGDVEARASYTALGGYMVGGEYLRATRIERMAENGRYAVAWES